MIKAAKRKKKKHVAYKRKLLRIMAKLSPKIIKAKRQQNNFFKRTGYGEEGGQTRILSSTTNSAENEK